MSAPFVEPGATQGTSFLGGMVTPEAIDAYDRTPVGEVRRAVAANAFPIPGDGTKVAQAILDCAEMQPAPKQLGLGSDTYTLVGEAWRERLALLESQKEIAFSVDVS